MNRVFFKRKCKFHHCLTFGMFIWATSQHCLFTNHHHHLIQGIGFGHRIYQQGLGFRIVQSMIMVQGSGLRVKGWKFQVAGCNVFLRFRNEGLGFEDNVGSQVQGLGFEFCGLGGRDLVSGFMVQVRFHHWFKFEYGRVQSMDRVMFKTRFRFHHCSTLGKFMSFISQHRFFPEHHHYPIQGLGSIYGLGFRIWDLGLKVQGVGFSFLGVWFS